jgi:hypothetical protein
VKNAHHSKKFNPHKAQGKSKNEKLPSLKTTSAASVVKNNDGKDVDLTSTSNGSVGLNSRPKQPSKSSSFNDRQVQLSKVILCLAFLAWPYAYSAYHFYHFI